MAKYRKKPVVIDAWQWIEITPAYPMPPVPHTHLREQRPWFRKSYWEVCTLEGWLKISSGDWMICGIQGEWYPCKPDIFEQTYEPV